MKRLIVILVAVAGFAGFAVPPAGGARPNGPGGVRPDAGRQVVRGERGPAKNVAQDRKQIGRGNGRGRDEASSRDEKLIDAINEAENLNALRRYSQQVRQAGEDARSAYVDALADKGERAVSELAGFLSDSSKDVADSAFDAWKNILDEMEVRRRVQMIVETASVLQQNGGRLQPNAGMPQHGPMGGVMQKPAMP